MSASGEEIREAVRTGDHARYLSAQFAPTSVRPGLLAVTAFALEISAIPARVKEPAMGQLRVAWWREVLVRIEAGDVPHHPAALALGQVWRPVLNSHLQAILDACDQEFSAAQAAVELLPRIDAYTQRAWLPILGVASPVAETAALHVGEAWGLIRRQATLQSLDAAEDHLVRARKALPEVPRAALPALLIGAIVSNAIQRQRRGGAEAGQVRRQFLLLRAALLGRF